MKVKNAKSTRVQKVRCASCGLSVPGYDVVNFSSIEKGSRNLCMRCFNTEVAELDGLPDFKHIAFEPVSIADCTGTTHQFHFRMRLFGPGVALDAFELRRGSPAGYQFKIIGDPEDDLLVLFGKLIEKIRRSLAVKHLKDQPLGVHIADRIVRGGIEWDELQDGHVPLLNIDGRDVTWHEFGRMLMTFEGWQFKLEIRDQSEEF